MKFRFPREPTPEIDARVKALAAKRNAKKRAKLLKIEPQTKIGTIKKNDK